MRCLHRHHPSSSTQTVPHNDSPLPTRRPTPGRDPRDIDRALTAFGLTLEAPPAHIDESVLNENSPVVTSDGPRVLRFLRKERDPERVLLEHRVMEHAASAGIPVPLPQLAAGRPFVRVGDRLVQLYPWVDGRHAGASTADAAALGAMQAATHRALSGFSDAELLAVGSAGRADWDTDQAIQVLSRVDDLIRYYPSPGETQLRIQEDLRFQLQLLESSEPRPPSDFSDLQPMLCHGDYHTRNVLLDNAGQVSAVVDWEIASLIPPVFELLRAISFSNYLDPPLLGAYLSGYASRGRLSAEECAIGVELWWQRRLHGTWVYLQRFIEGNRLVDRFLDEEAALLRRFADRGYRQWLSAELRSALTLDQE